MRLPLLLASLVAALALPITGWCQPAQVFVVRHAEKAEEPKDDPAISAEGVARAEALAQVLAASQIRSILTTQYRRTQETAAPTARRFGLSPKVVVIKRGEAEAHIAEMVAEIRKSAGPTLVVGHSNTVSGIVAALSSSKPLKLCETTFANLFVLTASNPELPAAQLKYGKPDVAPEAGCQ